MPTRVDLNADMGESYGRWTLGDDDALMPFLTSAHIACVLHGGDPHVMRRTVNLALEHGVGAGVPFVPEGYVDLDYDAAGKLVLERAKQVRDPVEMGEKAVRLVRERRVRTVDGGDLELEVESICVHGDAPNAPQIAKAIRDALERADIELAPLADLHTIAR